MSHFKSTPASFSLRLLWSVTLSHSRKTIMLTIMMIMELLFLSCLVPCIGQYTNVALDQGNLVGLKVFPESARTAVYAFLGIPYAQPPIGELRFAPPRAHRGWNGTLQATHMQSICPQPTNSIYDETAESKVAGNLSPDMEEDCLYLNVWVPEMGMRFGNLPVLVIITGEQMTFDWPRNRAIGLDFASEGVVVITLQYRSNIFGWISLGIPQLAGNYGLQDQRMVLQWLQDNVRHFGGNPREVTLLGHGTSGVACVLAHCILNSEGKSTTQTDTNNLFNRIILMSGGDVDTTLTASTATFDASRLLIRKLGCHYDVSDNNEVIKCLRAKSVSDLQRAFESIYDHSNASVRLGPILTSNPFSRRLTDKSQSLLLPPTMLGICSNEGAFMQDYWLHLAREGYASLSDYVNSTLLPNAMRQLGVPVNESNPLIDMIYWKYFSGEATTSTSHLLHAMQRFVSEINYEMPFYKLLERLATGQSDVGNVNSSLYAYVFDVANAMDLRGKINLFGGASHSSDLPLLLGPNLFQQIARRRFTAAEDKICRKMRTIFASFIKHAHPTPTGRSSSSNSAPTGDIWLPYTRDQKFIFSLGESVAGDAWWKDLTFAQNLGQIEKWLKKEESTGGASVSLSRSNRNDYRATNTEPDFRRIKLFSYSKKPLNSSSSAFPSSSSSSYAWHLKRVYSFWHLLVPSTINVDGRGGPGRHLTHAIGQHVRLLEASADVQRYRQGFFALLGLICMLLTVLSLCVYLLRRDSLRRTSALPSSSSSCYATSNTYCL